MASLIKCKPWLSCLPLKASKLDYLKKNFPIEEGIMGLKGKDFDDFKAEVTFV